MSLCIFAPWREFFFVALTINLVSSTANAGEITAETFLKGLNNPCGVAIRPGGSAVGFEVFVSDTGAGRIVKMALNKPGRSTDVVTGFAVAGSGAGPLETSGPRGLMFLGRRHFLAVGGGGDQEEALGAYELPDDDVVLQAGDAKAIISLPAPEDGGVGRLYGLARTQMNDRVPDEIVVAALAGEEQGWLGKSLVRTSATLGPLAPFTADNSPAPANLSGGIVVSDKGYVVVAVRDPGDKSGGCRLVFYNPIDGRPLFELPTELRDITGLAYSEETHNLYVCDFAAADPRQGGVYRLEDVSRPGQPRCQAVRIATVRRPTALAFGPDGCLYVTACGAGDGQGVLVRVTSLGEAL